MASFKEARAAVFEAAHKNGKNTKIHSQKDRNAMTYALINDTDYEYTTITSAADKDKKRTICPGKEMRNAMVSSFKKMGMDKDDAVNTANNFEFSKDFAAAMIDASDCSNIEYMRAGRALHLPMVDEESSSMTIYVDEVPEKIIESQTFVEDPETGNKTRKPTGEKVKTKKHKVVKVKNKTNDWLKKKIK